MATIGERAPDFVLPGPDGTPGRFYGHAGGRPTAVVILGSRASGTATSALAQALQSRADLAACWITRDRSVLPAGVMGWVDADGAVAARFGADPDTDTVVVLDPNLRVAAVVAADIGADHVIALLEGCRHAEPAVSVSRQAPVLMVPRVLDDATCAGLIEQCRIDSAETGVELSGNGARSESIDPALKRRRDLTVADQAQLKWLSATVGRRLMPELERAFAFRATRFEGFKVAWYDEESGGFFAAHRDNLTVSTAHRVFGLSLNLNDDYEGGELGFPEYGNSLYRAPAGAAMVFSCALLHAVHPVVRGSRFVLLSFLFAEPADARGR